MPEWYGGSALNPDETEDPKNQWMAQLHRVRRWYERILLLSEKSQVDELTQYDVDILITFFQNCYHLRDWIESARPELKKDVATLFKSSYELQGCRDICHGFKHKSLSAPSLDADFNLYREYDHFAPNGKNPIIYNVAFADGDDIKKFDVFEFADRCFNAWLGFLQDHELVRIVDNAC